MGLTPKNHSKIGVRLNNLSRVLNIVMKNWKLIESKTEREKFWPKVT